MNRTYDAMMQINSNLTNYETKEINKVIKKTLQNISIKQQNVVKNIGATQTNINKKFQIQSSGLETNEEKQRKISEEK